MKMDRKTSYLITALLLWAGVSTAAPFWFSQKAGAGSEAALADDLVFNNGQAITNLNAAELTCSRTNEGAALVYSLVWSGSDFFVGAGAFQPPNRGQECPRSISLHWEGLAP